jgi:hypothetical protein
MKTKPVKGSARTKRFDVGGTVGALAGLGTLAYLLSRKKKDAATGNEGSGESTAKPVIKSMMDTEDDAAKQRAMAASKGRPEMGDATNDDITTKKTTTPAVKKTAPSAKTTSTSKQGSVSTTGLDAGIAAGNKAKPNEERPSKPYPEKEAAAKKAADKAAAIKKATTAKGRSANPIAGTFESSGKSMARTPAQTMSERAREVQRRREEEMKSRYKNGGVVKKYADGGMTSSKPEPKKAPMPAFAREAKENRERDQKVKKEQDTYQKGEKTRLKEQGSMFKSGGMTPSKRADGIAMRGKTRGKMY